MKRVLVIGGGSIGERHVRCFQNTGRAEVLLCEIQDDVRSEIAARYSIDESFKHLETALDANFDASISGSNAILPLYCRKPQRIERLFISGLQPVRRTI